MASGSSTTTGASNKLSLIINLGLVYIIWGSTYFAIRIAIHTIPPLLMAGVRFLIAGGALYIAMRALKVPRPTLRQWAQAGLVGVLLLGGGNGAVTWVERQVPSSVAALLVALVPLWMVLLNWIMPGGARPTARTLAGVALGFGGVALLAFRGGATGGGLNPLALLLVASSFVWALGSVYASRASLPSSPLMSTAVEMLVGSVALLAGGLAAGEANQVHLAAISWQSTTALGFLIIFGSLIGYSAYTWLLKNSSPALVSTYAYVNPVVAMFLGVMFGNEQLGPVALIAAAIIIASVVLITLPGSAMRARLRASSRARATITLDTPALEMAAEPVCATPVTSTRG